MLTAAAGPDRAWTCGEQECNTSTTLSPCLFPVGAFQACMCGASRAQGQGRAMRCSWR